MWSFIRRQSLARQTLVGVVLICVVTALALSLALSWRTRQVALDESRRELQTQTDLIARTLEYAEESMKQDATRALDRFSAELPPAHLTGAKAVGVGSPLIKEGAGALGRIDRELEGMLQKSGKRSVNDIVGQARFEG